MSTIRCVYHPKNGAPSDPGFPATDQHPNAVRYAMGLYLVDALGGQPTQAELDAFLGTDAASVAEAQRKIDLDAAIAGDPTIQLLRGMTNAEFSAWWTANITTNAARDNVLMRVTRMAIRKLF